MINKHVVDGTHKSPYHCAWCGTETTTKLYSHYDIGGIRSWGQIRPIEFNPRNRVINRFCDRCGEQVMNNVDLFGQLETQEFDFCNVQ